MSASAYMRLSFSGLLSKIGTGTWHRQHSHRHCEKTIDFADELM